MAVEVERARKRFTRAEYRQMVDVGIIKPDDRVELIRGEIIEMSPPGSRHIAIVNNLNRLLVVALTDRAIVSVQNPVVVADDSEPQPDLAVLRGRSYMEAEPVREDVLLLIEVAETSLRYDRSTKLRLYAETGIPEYWVVDCAAKAVEVHRAAAADGYRQVARVDLDGTVSPAAFPDVSLAVRQIFT